MTYHAHTVNFFPWKAEKVRQHLYLRYNPVFKTEKSVGKKLVQKINMQRLTILRSWQLPNFENRRSGNPFPIWKNVHSKCIFFNRCKYSQVRKSNCTPKYQRLEEKIILKLKFFMLKLGHLYSKKKIQIHWSRKKKYQKIPLRFWDIICLRMFTFIYRWEIIWQAVALLCYLNIYDPTPYKYFDNLDKTTIKRHKAWFIF